MPETGYHGDWEMESKLLTAVTGVTYTEEMLEEISLKIWNMERCYSLLDIGRCRDYDMYITHCHDARGGDWTMGFHIDPFRFGKLLDRYYALEGWDEDGVPTEETLLKYSLSAVIEAGWVSMLPMAKAIPVEWDLTVPYGVFYSRHPSQMVHSFIQILKKEMQKS